MAFKTSVIVLVICLSLFKTAKRTTSFSIWLDFDDFKQHQPKFKTTQPNTLVAFASIKLASRHRYASIPGLNFTSTSRVTHLLLIIASDCSTLNPGPIKHPCGVCKKPTKSNQRAICCDECNNWMHVKCISMSCESYLRYSNDSKLTWICNVCAFPNYSTRYFLDDLSVDDDNSFAPLSDASFESTQAFVTSTPRPATRTRSHRIQVSTSVYHAPDADPPRELFRDNSMIAPLHSINCSQPLRSSQTKLRCIEVNCNSIKSSEEQHYLLL